MRELSTCDFCGGEAAGVYEVVPGDIPGVSARRMVLCEGCRDTLADIVDPLLDAGRAGGRAKAKRGSEVSHSAATMSEPDSESGNEAESATEPEPATEPDAATESDVAADPVPEPGSGPSVDPDSAAEPGPESESGPVPESDPRPANEEAAESAAAEPEPVERPAEYGKVVRLVENRDAGIPRSDLEELATSAYGLSHDDVEEAIDFALEHGTFEEASSGLKTT